MNAAFICFNKRNSPFKGTQTLVAQIFQNVNMTQRLRNTERLSWEWPFFSYLKHSGKLLRVPVPTWKNEKHKGYLEFLFILQMTLMHNVIKTWNWPQMPLTQPPKSLGEAARRSACDRGADLCTGSSPFQISFLGVHGPCSFQAFPDTGPACSWGETS